MSSIRVLPDRVANQIAAGEVVERPAAVVKELIENSLDAGARRIEIEFRNGGKSYLRVEDDGHGMRPDDALLSLERHGTSKIREADDLQTVTSFGFRGEALPSIASVSRFTLRTRAKGQDGGTEILVNGGKLIHQKDCGMPEGTRIEVARLFNSVPARRKFLRTDNTESAHICRLARLYAMAHPETAFTLLENERTIFRSPTCADLRDRLREIFGGGFADDLVAVDAESEDFTLTGLMSKPGVGRSTRKEMIFMVNNRPVDSKALSYAVIEAYHTYVPKGRYPSAFLFLGMKPSAVDVNVHPTKREVRFREEGRLRAFIIRTINGRLLQLAQGAVSDLFSSAPQTASTDVESDIPSTIPTLDTSSLPVDRGGASAENIVPNVTATENDLPTTDLPRGSDSLEKSEPSPVAGRRDEIGASWRFLDKLAGDLALFRTNDGLVVLHCRAALERIRFEETEDIFSQKEAREGQGLLLPIPLELDAFQTEILQAHLPMLEKVGFQVAEFGRNFHRLEAIPSWMEPEAAELFLRDLISLARERGGNVAKTLGQDELIRMVSLSGESKGAGYEESEIISLVDQLLRCRNPLRCPLGHPTYVEYGRKEWEAQFGRRF